MTDSAEAEQALAIVTDHLLPGRWAESRPMTEKEIRSTGVLRVEIEAASLKVRSGQVIDEEEDYALPIWGGVIPTARRGGRARGGHQTAGRRGGARIGEIQKVINYVKGSGIGQTCNRQDIALKLTILNGPLLANRNAFYM